jgi:hypothetical protein
MVLAFVFSYVRIGFWESMAGRDGVNMYVL